jgi:addiction module RelE/StbE family toxin
MRIRYTPRAFADREAIFHYIEERSPQAAGDVFRRIKQRINELAEQPYTGTKTTRPGIYKLWIAPYPYRVFYRVDGDDIVILRIRHTSRRPL